MTSQLSAKDRMYLEMEHNHEDYIRRHPERVPEVLGIGAGAASALVCDDVAGYEMVSEEMVGKSRWHVQMETVVRRLSDGLLFLIQWSSDQNGNGNHEFPTEAHECHRIEQTVYKYVRTPGPSSTKAATPSSIAPTSGPATLPSSQRVSKLP